ncbi:hypothetical protein [Draconibacterium sediminis]|uniref:Cohesin domain-containing protein n=1 Tax=Draconibacterium sediminis TaxID=1544798 RepID=A0A0D8JBX9_9BACT|nr:hypothetical protein [Draconibacterium sediminis]KJF44500.1 hypothetical protein LH29_03160 [Draconibacterium sediminis]
MKTITTIIVALLLGLVLCRNASAQFDEKNVHIGFSLPEVALMDVEYIGNGTIEFELLPAAESGGSPVIRQLTSQEFWINYSSALGKFSPDRSIVAQIAGGTVPEGLELYILAADYSGNGEGKTGASAGKVLVGSDPRPIITGIGSAYTGNGIGNGHQLNFEIDISQMEKVSASGSHDFTILYTLTDN